MEDPWIVKQGSDLPCYCFGTITLHWFGKKISLLFYHKDSMMLWVSREAGAVLSSEFNDDLV